MRIRVAHKTRYDYRPPAKGAIQLLRLTPRSHESQHVRFWRIEVDRDCMLRASEDSLGNLTHMFNVDGPLDQLAIFVDGEVDIDDAAGMVRGTMEPFPPGLFLRNTELTTASPDIRALAIDAATEASGDPLATLHAIMTRLSGAMRFDIGATDATTTADKAFALGHGVCQDFAHICIAAARSCEIPARYVSGYLLRSDGQTSQEAGHAWMEAHIEGLGWVGFDPANGVSPTNCYVRVAVGLDYLGAAPVLGARYGGGGEKLKVEVRVDEARQQTQS
ncbi:MAG TPA: transglutaminase family protein [Beijerinckiaceae bacterium]|nr:transglutaminase family protein [Beijerinckiaceae bacterium]